MRFLIRFIRIYAPFICSIVAFINGVLFLNKEAIGDVAFIFSSLTGNSLLVDVYMYVTSLKMCIWYKLNLICLILVQICGLLYNYFNFEESLYVWIFTILSIIGIICLLIFKALYKVTEFGCSRRH